MNRDLSGIGELIRREKHQSFESIPDFLKETKDEKTANDDKTTETTTASDHQPVQTVDTTEDTGDDKTDS